MKNNLRIQNRTWLVDDEGAIVFGEGRLRILKAVDETGSLAEAARTLGMSYRAVWGKVKATEERLEVSLVERNSGRRKGRSATLTSAARLLMERYEKIDAETRAFCEKSAKCFLDIPTEKKESAE